MKVNFKLRKPTNLEIVVQLKLRVSRLKKERCGENFDWSEVPG